MVEEATVQLLFMMSLYSLLTVVCRGCAFALRGVVLHGPWPNVSPSAPFARWCAETFLWARMRSRLMRSLLWR